jgi:hypothetical protein
MEIEQRSVIKFFIDEGMKPPGILRHFHKYYDPRALCRSTLYFWIGEVRQGRTDFSEIPGLGKTADEDPVTVIARPYAQDPHLSS